MNDKSKKPVPPGRGGMGQDSVPSRPSRPTHDSERGGYVQEDYKDRPIVRDTLAPPDPGRKPKR
ncbi:hypothetical protein [Paraburkholderia solisilvae]|uniref:Uncharacterized protein n=1 Tax=Paraburkholderia solisilvae TaxID=624376 RepID=A0A6J5EZN5_9BURK|nr:hypothetical protein [Paraburkholderia solisilvae]CAB3770486.1 hypothetical protein LMG29739_05797 [Paraburkholderia solisilvae]